MPRVSAVPPQILLAPTTADNPLVPINTYVEPTVKDAEVQTMFRESEAQTTPYTPAYTVAEGESPEVLLLKNLTYQNGLPLGKKEIEIIEYARAKREMEINLPPFTDEASLNLRKRLMEQQELREFRLREAEIDIRREEKLVQLEQVLVEREESNEFMTSQRLEGIRMLRMEEREQVLQKIRNKRIKALRRIAHQRNISDPILSDGTGRDIINDYFDKGSNVYAPVIREGREIAQNPARFDVASRTVPLDNIGNILSLEYTIPKQYLDHGGTENENNMNPTQLSKTAPVGSAVNMRTNRVAEPRMTSAAARNLRNTKRDVEEMHQILNIRKRDPNRLAQTSGGSTTPGSPEREAPSSPVSKAGTANAATKKVKGGRPVTPDFTVGRVLPIVPSTAGGSLFSGSLVSGSNNNEGEEAVKPPPAPVALNVDDSLFIAPHEDEKLQASIILLQRLIRGRAVQNIMFEGKYRRRELINELKMADEMKSSHHDVDNVKLDLELQIEREERLRETTYDAVAGGATANILHFLVQEKVSFMFDYPCCKYVNVFF